MAEVQASLSAQLQNELILLQTHVQLLVLQLLQHLRSGQNANVRTELSREKQDRRQAVAELHDRLEKHTKMVANMEETQRTEKQETSARMSNLEKALRIEQQRLPKRKGHLEALDCFENQCARDKYLTDTEETRKSRKARAVDNRFESLKTSRSELSENKTLQNVEIAEADTFLEVEEFVDQEGSVEDTASKATVEKILKKEKPKNIEATAYMKQLEAAKQIYPENLQLYKERFLMDAILFFERAYNVAVTNNHTTTLDALSQQLHELSTDLKQLHNASPWQEVKKLNTQVYETGLKVSECSVGNRTLGHDNVTQLLEEMRKNSSLLQMRLETADKEIEVLEKLNTRLVSQKHDMEKPNVILKYHLLRLKSELDKCLPVARQLPKEKALVLNLQTRNQNCTTSLENKTTELSTVKMNVKNLSSVVSKLTEQVQEVNRTAESKWKERMRKTVALLRYTTVLEAVKAGDLAVTEFLVEAGEAVNSRDVANVGLTPLHWAARKGRLQVAQLLLRNGASLNAKSDLGYTPLLEAAYNGHTDVCRLLLDNGAEVNTTNNYKNTPLHWAASKNHLATVELLVKRGANCEAKNKGGYTPLQLATGHGNTAVAKWLSDWCHRGPHSN